MDIEQETQEMELTQELLDTKLTELSGSSALLAGSGSSTTQLVVTSAVADQISVAYNTMPGNQPNTYGNYVAIWQNSDSIPWNTDPLQTQQIVSNTQAGDMIFSGLNITVNSYIIGYGVGPQLTGTGVQKQGNICSTVFVPAVGGGAPTQFLPSIQVLSIGANSVAVSFNLPSGILPQSNGAWIGLWRAEQASYNNPPVAANSIQVNAGQGSGFINGVTIGRGLTYTIGLFMSGWGGGSSPNNQKPLACSVTFMT
jgi:hypothetical protein